MAQTIIHQISENDLPALVKISKQTFVETFAEVNTPENMAMYLDNNLSATQLSDELNNINSLFYFSKTNGIISGYLKINIGNAQTENQIFQGLEIERIYVLKKFLGKKIGQQLLEHAFEIAKSLKLSIVWLGVWEHNSRAIQFYQKNGFAVFGQHYFYLDEDKQTDLLMKLHLD